MSTLAAARARIDQLTALGLRGTAIVVVPPGAQRRIADDLAREPGRAVVDLGDLALDTTPRVAIVAGLPQGDAKQVADAVAHFNGMRDYLGARERLTVLVLTRRELATVQRHAGDTYSVVTFVVDVAFEPDPAVDFDDARRALELRYRERHGRLDLRGFVRSEGEDVAWRIEDLYQDLSATVLPSPGDGETVRVPSDERPVSTWLAKGGAFVVLGHPGAGKSFLLRWLALAMTREATVLGIERPLPVLASLAAFAEAPGPITLDTFFVETLLEASQPAAHVLHRAIAERRAVFLLDGLDEAGDDGRRARIVDAIAALRSRAPGCLLVATSRIAGYDAAPLSDATQLVLSPFDDAAIGRFLRRWCELYAVDRAGDTPTARKDGAREGDSLARDVLAHREVLALARNPLLLTVIAIVHRTGVRLPDHRVELYDHATRVLVERWNRVRSVGVSHPAPPLKSADAVRLLGPVALAMIRSSAHGVLTEEALRRHLDAALKSGSLRGIATTDEALALFRNALGLLVEQGPGVYAFLHLTLAEYFAAWELTRSDALEKLASREVDVYRPGWREVMLLAAGVLGVLRAEDQRLDALVDRLIQSAARRRGRPSTGVPSLLAGVLADDPGLSHDATERLAKTLVPTWWFERAYGASRSLTDVVYEASRLMFDRFREGRAAEAVRRELRRAYGDGLPDVVYHNLQRGIGALNGMLLVLMGAHIDNGPAMLSCLRFARRSLHFALRVFVLKSDGGVLVVRVFLSRSLDVLVHSGTLRGTLHGTAYDTDIETHEMTVDWLAGRPTGWISADYVEREYRFPVQTPVWDFELSLSLREVDAPPPAP